jgi:hypothetical protein
MEGCRYAGGKVVVRTQAFEEVDVVEVFWAASLWVSVVLSLTGSSIICMPNFDLSSAWAVSKTCLNCLAPVSPNTRI